MASQLPASIRFNNPGAQYPGRSADRFGSTGYEIIGGGHKIAVFDNPINGAAAQFDLMSNNYRGMTLADAIEKWSGGNSTNTYLNVIQRETGLRPDTVLTPELLRDPNVAVPLARAMAVQEAGRPYPLTNEQWTTAFQMAHGGEAPPPSTNTQTAASTPPGMLSGLLSPSTATQTAPPPGLLSGLVGDQQPAPDQQAAPQGGLISFGPDGSPTLNPGAVQFTQTAEAATEQGGDIAEQMMRQLQQKRPVDLSRLMAVLQSRQSLT